MRFIPQCSHGYSRLPNQMRGKLLFLIKIKMLALKNHPFASKRLKKYLAKNGNAWRDKMSAEDMCYFLRSEACFWMLHCKIHARSTVARHIKMQRVLSNKFKHFSALCLFLA